MSQQSVTVPIFKEITDGTTISLTNTAGFSVLTSAATTATISSFFNGNQISQMDLPASQTMEVASSDSNSLTEITILASGGSVYLVAMGGQITTI
jgi:hypothetical protein